MNKATPCSDTGIIRGSTIYCMGIDSRVSMLTQRAVVLHDNGVLDIQTGEVCT